MLAPQLNTQDSNISFLDQLLQNTTAMDIQAQKRDFDGATLAASLASLYDDVPTPDITWDEPSSRPRSPI